MLESLVDKIRSRLDHAAENTEKASDINWRELVQLIVQSRLPDLYVVPRDEFLAQTKVLARSREKLEALEKEVAALEAKLQSQTNNANSDDNHDV